MAEQKKKMPHVLHLTLFLFVLGVICAGLLSLVNQITKPVIEANVQKELEATLASVNVTEPKLLEEVTLVAGVDKVYQGKVDGTTECYVFQVTVKNSYTTITTLVVIGKTDALVKAVATVSGTPSYTTHGKDSGFINNNFGLIGAGSTNYQDQFKGVASATVSSSSILEAVKLSYQQMKGLAK